jgi:hypothetical protein
MPVMGMIWANKCGSTEDMFYPSSVVTLTSVKPIITSAKSMLPPCPNNSQKRIVVFCFGEDD